MTDNDDGFTADQAAAATSALRGAIGLEPQRFPTEQFVGMISDEIEQLRGAGKSDDDIARILADGANIRIDAATLARYYAPPDERRRPG